MDARSRREELPRLDGRLADAVSKDMAAYMGRAMSSVALGPKARGVHSIRARQALTRFGWCGVRYPYRVGGPGGRDVFRAFGVERKMTPSASSVATRLAATPGSFREAADTLALLGCGRLSASKLREETLRVGEAELAASRSPGKDVRRYPEAKLRTPDGARGVPRTLVVMSDGTPPAPGRTRRVSGAGTRSGRSRGSCG